MADGQVETPPTTHRASAPTPPRPLFNSLFPAPPSSHISWRGAARRRDPTTKAPPPPSPSDLHRGDDVLVDAVIVPLIERRHLVHPDGLAGFDLAANMLSVHLLSKAPLLHSWSFRAANHGLHRPGSPSSSRRAWCQDRSCTSPKPCRRRASSPRRGRS